MVKMESDHRNRAMEAWSLQREMGKRRLSIIEYILVAHNFGQGVVWMIAQVADDCITTRKLGVSTLE
jgi:hypothetical protein